MQVSTTTRLAPSNAHLKYTGRGEYIVADDFQCPLGLQDGHRAGGIIPALESSHGLWGGMQLAKTLPKDKDVVMWVCVFPFSVPC